MKDNIKIAKELVKVARELVATKTYMCWCAYRSRGDKWVRVKANSPQQAKELVLEKEKARGIERVVSVKEDVGQFG